MLRSKLKAFSVLFWTSGFSWACPVQLLKCPSRQCLSLKGKKVKNKGGRRGTNPLYPRKVILAEDGVCNNGRRCSNNGCHLFVCTSVIISNNQQLEHRSLALGGQGLSFLFTLAPTSCVWTAPGTHAQLSATGLRGGGISYCCYAKSWNGWKLITTYHLSLPLEVVSPLKDFRVPE